MVPDVAGAQPAVVGTSPGRRPCSTTPVTHGPRTSISPTASPSYGSTVAVRRRPAGPRPAHQPARGVAVAPRLVLRRCLRAGARRCRAATVSVMPQACSDPRRRVPSRTPPGASAAPPSRRRGPAAATRGRRRAPGCARAARSRSSAPRRRSWAVLGLDQPDQRLGLQEPVRHDQVRAGHHRGVRQAPGVRVEHRHHRQHPVVLRQRRTRCPVQTPIECRYDRPVAVDDALRVPGGAAGVAHRRRRPLVQFGPAERVGLGGEQVLVGVHLTARRRPGRARRPPSVTCSGHDDVPDRGGVRQHLGQQRHQGRVDDDHVVARVGGDVADHLRVEPQVQRVQHRAHGRNGQVGLEMLGVVPHQRGHALVAVHAEAAQRVRQLRRPGAGRAVALPPRCPRASGHDLAGRRSRRAVAHHRGHRQRNVHHRALARATSAEVHGAAGTARWMRR